MQHQLIDIEGLRALSPKLLDWDRVCVRVIKDPAKPLSTVSDLGVPHTGMERDSSVCRISDGAGGFIVKRHTDPVMFRREVANLTFVNEAGQFAPEHVCCDGETGTIVMEDLGDRSLAYVWKEGRMDEYERWVYRTVDLVLAVQSHFNRDGPRLRALYRDLCPESPIRSFPVHEPVEQLEESLRLSRGITFADADRDALLSVFTQMNGRLERFHAAHRDFCLGLSPWHIIEKEGRIRVIDLTFAPIGPVLDQFGNLTWHLENARGVSRRYLAGRDTLGLPRVDHDEFLLLEAWQCVLGCILWIRIYCKEILEDEQSLVDLTGQRLTDYAGNESANLEAIRRALEPHSELSAFAEILRRYFSAPLRENH